MTREEAVIILEGFKNNPLFNSTHVQAFAMAISALSENKGDLISRQAVLNSLKEHRTLYCDNTPDTFSKLSYAEKSRVDELDTAIATIINLPSVENKGEWIDNGNGSYTCSNCKTEWTTSQIEKMCFCPTCGADMREPIGEKGTE